MILGNAFLQSAAKLYADYKKSKWLKGIVRTLAIFVVFCTTYILILPAITMRDDPICGYEAHVHNIDCYTESELYEYTCSFDESVIVIHTHDTFCYNAKGELYCTLTEIKEHLHDELCYDETQTLNCGYGNAVVHNHTEECLKKTGEAELVLTCLLTVHEHVDACYPMDARKEDAYLCDLGAHQHSDACYDDLGELDCSVPVHEHEAACLIYNLDLTADVETEEEWSEFLNNLTLTGNWPTDIIAVAETQLDYQGSQKNVVLVDGELNSYTRYGAWYGYPYEDWDAMFASFVLNYSFVCDFPLSSDSGEWVSELVKAGRYAESDSYFPKIGDLVFFDYDQSSGSDADHVGIVASITPAVDDHPVTIKVIEGDVNNTVSYVTYELHNENIVGYGVVPNGDVTILSYHGADYTVKVRYGTDAKLPENVRLTVKEILPGTDEYEYYYDQSVIAMTDDNESEEAEELMLSFARFFDISFVSDGVTVEPESTVHVQISYTDAIDQNAEDVGVAVHFADDGVELLNAEVSGSDEDVESGDSTTEKVDTFDFSQGSFSVVGTVLANYPRAIGITTATTVNFNTLNASGNVQYVLYTLYNGQYYAITAKTGDTTGYAVPITVNSDGTISWETSDNGMFWSFSRNGTAGSSYYIQNYGSARYIHAFDNSTSTRTDYGTTTGGRNSSTLTSVGDGQFTARGNNYYTGIVISNGNVTFNRVSNQSQAAKFYLAVVGEFYNVWFDGTNGGLMGLYGSDNLNSPAVKNSNGSATTITLPETWTSPAKYGYTLQGWYDITSQTYYKVDPNDEIEVTAQISQDTVFYADWIAATYDVGIETEDTVDSLDTDDFIATHVFDYNVLFNVLSLTSTGTITSATHSETWSMVQNGNIVPYTGELPLNFVLVDYDAGGDISYANGRNTQNNNQSTITAGILQNVYQTSGGKDLLDLLFNHETDVIGKNYVGTGNYLFQYMDSTTENYDGEHDGYYYLDARYNAASYNQTNKRFYLYNYLERTSDSRKDGGIGIYSDFLPFNSPYIFDEDQIDQYLDSILTPGYEYDAKDSYTQNNIVYSSIDDAGTNYWFGINSRIEFFLPDESGSQDQYGNYGNISTRGEHMVFEFHGDDDLWVCVDGELLLDVGGVHGVMYGEIDFSVGTVTYGKDGGEVTTKTFEEILGHNISDGTHIMNVYYMERGSSQSNCSIYFNLAPRYALELTKEDIYTTEKLDGAVFSIYTCEACANDICSVHATPNVAQLWDSIEDYNSDMDDNGVPDSHKYQFTVVDGVAKCWGLSAGKTYYIKETTPPSGYPSMGDDLIRITLNNRGTATIETTTLHGPDGDVTEGYAAIESSVNDTLKIVSMLFTNQKDEETTKIRVEKVWDPMATDLPNSIIVYLSADGVRVPRYAVLTESNGWTYTWTGLPKYKLGDNSQLIEVEYTAEEIQVPGFETNSIITKNLPEQIKWVKTDSLEDGVTYVLLNGGRALAYNSVQGFYWMTQANAQDSTLGLDAQWSVTTNQYGFRLKNASGYYLTYDHASGNSSDYFYGATVESDVLNQVIYYLENRLVAHDHDLYFQLDLGGDAVSEDGLVFSLVRKDIVNGTVIEIENMLVDNDDQTYVTVNKVWADTLHHTADSVVVHLYADGVETGISLTLSEANGWQGIFEGLPYYGHDGVTPIVYTVVEDEPPAYDAEYDYDTAPGVKIITWLKVSDLGQSGNYRIFTGANALAIDSYGNLIVKENDPNDQFQWWTPVVSGGRTVLKHSTRDVYLYSDGTNVSVVNNASSASTVILSGDALTINGRYLQMTKTSISVSEHPFNATLFTVAIRTEGEGMPGLDVTVTNVDEAEFKLPATGAAAELICYTLGSILVLTAAVMYIYQRLRKGKKGGSLS